MTARSRVWSVHVTASAQADLQDIIDWTVDWFGGRQAGIYLETLAWAVDALTSGPATIGVKKVPGSAKGLFTLHVARSGRKGRHVVLFRLREESGDRQVEVLRLLHDSMDIPSHAVRAAQRR